MSKDKAWREEIVTRMGKVPRKPGTSLRESLDEEWNTIMGDDSLWRLREELYRETPILGWFRRYKRFRVWNIRRKVRK